MFWCVRRLDIVVCSDCVVLMCVFNMCFNTCPRCTLMCVCVLKCVYVGMCLCVWCVCVF